MKIFVLHVNAYLKVSTKNRFFKIMLSDVSPFPPATPMLRTHEQSGQSARGRGSAQAQQHRFLLTKADLATTTSDFIISQQQRLN